MDDPRTGNDVDLRPALLASIAVEDAKKRAAEEVRMVRGGAVCALGVVTRMLWRVAVQMHTAPLATTTHSLGLAIAALKDIRDALISVEQAGG